MPTRYTVADLVDALVHHFSDVPAVAGDPA
jgi:hypothetical protein